MGLKKEVHIKINGNYIQGSVISGIFKTNELVDTKRATNGQNQFTVGRLKLIIEELQELVDTMEGIQVANLLTKENYEESPF